MDKKRIPFVLIGAATTAALYMVVNHFYGDERFPNAKICKTLKPGITVDEIRQRMRVKRIVENWIHFETNPINPGLIQARMDDSQMRVLELVCSDDGPPEWKLD